MNANYATGGVYNQPPYSPEPYYSNDDMIGLANEMNQMNFDHVRTRPQRRGNRGRNGRNRNKRGRGRGGMRGGRRNNRRDNNYHSQGEMGYNNRGYNNNFQPHPPQPMLDSTYMRPLVHGVPQMYAANGHNVIPMNMPQNVYQQNYQNQYHRDYQAEEEPKSIEDVQGRIYSLARTQAGCRTLQKLLDKNPSCFKLVFSELQDHIGSLVSDPFGHHLCLRLIDYIEEHEMREILLQQLKEDLVAVSLSVHGTRVIQKLLEMMQTPLELQIVQDAMSMYVITLAKDVYGMHVILRCLHRIPPPSGDDSEGPSNQFIFEEITKNIVSVATHKHGCCVVQWCIDYATPKQRKKLVEVVVTNSLELAQDAFGNYVVQQIMDPTHPEVLQKLVSHLSGSVNKLAVQKFSSIVIEKCLEYTESTQQMQIINELVNPQKLPRLLQDPYANYVIQKALSVTRQENFQKVVEVIRPHLETLSVTPFGKRIKTQMIRRFPILSMGPKTTNYGNAPENAETTPVGSSPI